MKTNSTNLPPWKIELLYDGDCPLCVKEVNFLRQKDRGRGLVNFVNIADLNYNPNDHQGIDYERAMGRIHAIVNTGEIIKDVAVFRVTYQILGMGWLYAITRIKLMENIANFIYGIWANLRLKLTGRPDLDTLVKLRQECIKNGQCKIN